VDVEMSRGRYGQFKVLVDGRTIVDAGALAALGVLPSSRTVLDAVRKHLAAAKKEPAPSGGAPHPM
jgi:hypothetical protein